MTGETEPERILRRFNEEGVKAVALKLGANGAGLLWEGQISFVDRHPVKPVDTTGAGDSFDAGFLHAWLRGEAPEDCLRIASICGALSTEGLGGLNAFPSRDRLESELKKSECAKSR